MAGNWQPTASPVEIRCGVLLRQAKEGGKKTVVTLSSSMAQLERLAGDARAPDKPLGPFDTAQFAYKVSKTGLNQGAHAGDSHSDISGLFLRATPCQLHQMPLITRCFPPGTAVILPPNINSVVLRLRWSLCRDKSALC